MGDAATALGRLINQEITSTGPMGLARYMALCLTHPKYGYYTHGDPLGTTGDFITAPEISQIFGEMVGVWITLQWRALGEPEHWTLAEPGPGRGTLLADAMRVVKRAGANPELLLFETNFTLRHLQKERLARYGPRWHSSVADLETGDGPVIVLANEFFDALPIAQYQRTANGWHERLIGLRDGHRCWGLSGNLIATAAMPEALANAGPNEIYEQGAAGEGIIGELAAALAKRGGAGLVIDYGYAKTRTGVSLQAVSGHGPCDPLSRPGEIDLTAHVNFEALAGAVKSRGATPAPLITQGEFLARMGAGIRAEALMAAQPTRADEIRDGVDRLMAPDQMGTLFKVLEFTSTPT